MKEVEIVQEIRARIPEHQILLSFLHDEQGELFADWWREKGEELFWEWANDNDNGLPF